MQPGSLQVVKDKPMSHLHCLMHCHPNIYSFPLRNKLKGNRGGIVRSGGKTENGSHTDTWRSQPDTEEAGKQDGQCIDQ